MGQLLVRNVDDDVIARLKVRALGNGRSVEAEHRDILRSALADDGARQREAEALRQEFARLRAETAGRGGPSAEVLQREGRDER